MDQYISKVIHEEVNKHYKYINLINEEINTYINKEISK